MSDHHEILYLKGTGFGSFSPFAPILYPFFYIYLPELIKSVKIQIRNSINYNFHSYTLLKFIFKLI
jgi:hypothetical protein